MCVGVLGDVEIELVHGRLQAEAKRDALERFSSGAAPVLVATTVVEVRLHCSQPQSLS